MSDIRYATAGRRRTIHRVTVTEGVRQVGTERCNLDDAAHRPVEVEAYDFEPGWESRMCGWCFPRPSEVTSP